MSDFKRYHAAIEIKSIVSYHLRRISEIRIVVEDSKVEELIGLFNESEQACQRLYTLASEIADTDRCETKVPEYADRGIDDFLSGADCGCDDDCSGGCSGCGGGCNP